MATFRYRPPVKSRPIGSVLPGEILVRDCGNGRWQPQVVLGRGLKTLPRLPGMEQQRTAEAVIAAKMDGSLQPWEIHDEWRVDVLDMDAITRIVDEASLRELR